MHSDLQENSPGNV